MTPEEVKANRGKRDFGWLVFGVEDKARAVVGKVAIV